MHIGKFCHESLQINVLIFQSSEIPNIEPNRVCKLSNLSSFSPNTLLKHKVYTQGFMGWGYMRLCCHLVGSRSLIGYFVAEQRFVNCMFCLKSWIQFEKIQRYRVRFRSVIVKLYSSKYTSVRLENAPCLHECGYYRTISILSPDCKQTFVSKLIKVGGENLNFSKYIVARCNHFYR